jgi:hypothetical protein
VNRELQSAHFPLWDTIFRSRSFRIFTVGAEFPVSPGVMRIFNAPNAHLVPTLLSWD